MSRKYMKIFGASGVACHILYTLITSQQPNSILGRLVEVSASHTIRHTVGGTPLDERSTRRIGSYLHNTKQIIIHVLSEIRTRDPSNQAVAELRLIRTAAGFHYFWFFIR